MNPISDSLPVAEATPDPQAPAGSAPPVQSDAFAAMLAAAAALGPPPTPGQAEAARTAPAEGTEAGSDSPGPSESIGVSLTTSAASQSTPGYTPATGALGEEIDDPTAAPTDAAAPSEQASADQPVADPAAPATAKPRTPDSENPAAIEYAQMRLQQLVRAGVIERVPDGDPTAAWRELSKDVRAIAERAGFADPREFLAHGHVAQQPASAEKPTEPPQQAPTAPPARKGADIPISYSQTAPAGQPSTAAQPTEAVAVQAAAPAQRDASQRGGSSASDDRAATRQLESTSPAGGGGASTPVQASPAAEREQPVLRPTTARLHELVDKAQATIRVAVRQGHTDARITLRPPELGEVKITLRYEGGGVSALLTADSGKAVEVLAQASADLRRSLEQQGLSVHGLDVRLAGDDARESAAGRDANQPVPAPFAGYRDDDPDHDQQPESTAAPTRIAGTGRIDVLA